MTARKWMVTATMALAGCAPTLKSRQGFELLHGTVEPLPTVPAVRAECRATLLRSGKTFRFDVWIECDSTHGRLDAMGPFNTPLASVVWTDSSWTTWLPGQGTLLRGSGSTMNLPVLDLRNVSPRMLVSALLGRAMSVKGPVRTLRPANGQVVVLPGTASEDPAWALLLDQSTGLPLRHQYLSQGKETEGIEYFDWKDRDGVLVPGKIVRTTPDGQILELVVRQWMRLDSVPKAHTALQVPSAVDTITVGLQGNGRKVFRIRGGTGTDSTVVVLPTGGFSGPSDFADPDSTALPDDSTSDDTVETDDTPPPTPVSKAVQPPPAKL
jgi:hypothetical protein